MIPSCSELSPPNPQIQTQAAAALSLCSLFLSRSSRASSRKHQQQVKPLPSPSLCCSSIQFPLSESLPTEATTKQVPCSPVQPATSSSSSAPPLLKRSSTTRMTTTPSPATSTPLRMQVACRCCCSGWRCLGAAQPQASSLADEDGEHKQSRLKPSRCPPTAATRLLSTSPRTCSTKCPSHVDATVEPSVVVPQVHVAPATFYSFAPRITEDSDDFVNLDIEAEDEERTLHQIISCRFEFEARDRSRRCYVGKGCVASLKVACGENRR